MKVILLFLCLFIGTSTRTISAAEDSEVIIQKEIDNIFVNQKFNGVSLISQSDNIVHLRGYGMAVQEWNILNKPSTRYQIASISKTFTAVLIMLLVEEGKLSLDEPLSSYLPSYPSNYSKQITIKQLLLHRTGISRQFKIPGWKRGKSKLSISQSDFLSLIAAMPLEFEPGKKRHYSSANYYILGAVIEQVTGQSFDSVLRERILKPLNMNDSGVYREGEIVPRLANAYKHIEGKYAFCPPVTGDYCLGGNVNFALYKASGSMYSNIYDLYKWSLAIKEKKILSKESWMFLMTPDTHASWRVTDVSLSDSNKTKIVISDGELEGYSSVMVRFPEENISIILISNSGDSYEKLVNIVIEIAKSIDI